MKSHLGDKRHNVIERKNTDNKNCILGNMKQNKVIAEQKRNI